MLTFRPAEAHDAAKIAPIMLLAMEDIVYYFIGERNLQKAVDVLTYFIAQEGNQYSYTNILVAEEDQEILGQLCLYDGGQLEQLRQPILNHLKEVYQVEVPSAEYETQAGEIYIDTIAVSANAQGKGIGKQLLQFAIDKFVHNQGKTLGLLVDKDNPAAKKLYLNIGFKIVNELQIFKKEMEHLQLAPEA